MLIALAVLALIAAAAAAAVRGAARTWEAAGGRAEAMEEVAVAQALLRRQLAEALAAPPAVAGGTLPAFAGDAGGMAWVGRRPARLMPASPYLARLFLEDAPAGGRLVITFERIDRLGDPTPAPVRRAVLLEGIAAVDLAYLGEDGWRTDWPPEAGVPLLVRLRLEPAEGAPWRWPELVAAVAAGIQWRRPRRPHGAHPSSSALARGDWVNAVGRREGRVSDRPAGRKLH
jgi:hypothetical protein